MISRILNRIKTNWQRQSRTGKILIVVTVLIATAITNYPNFRDLYRQHKYEKAVASSSTEYQTVRGSTADGHTYYFDYPIDFKEVRKKALPDSISYEKSYEKTLLGYIVLLDLGILESGDSLYDELQTEDTTREFVKQLKSESSHEFIKQANFDAKFQEIAPGKLRINYIRTNVKNPDDIVHGSAVFLVANQHFYRLEVSGKEIYEQANDSFREKVIGSFRIE